MTVGRCCGGAFFVRAGPLSHDKVIEILNHYYVPIYLSVDDYDKDGSAPAEEKTTFYRLFGEAGDPKKGIGYVISRDGMIFDTFISSPAVTSEKVVSFLEGAAQKLNVSAGQMLGKPEPQAVVPKPEPGFVTLHLTARYLPPGDGWARMPAEDYIVLDPEEWSKLLPPDKAALGTTWDIDKKVAAKILIHFYPAALNFYYADNRIDQQTLKATVVADKDGVARVRLDGSLKMKHTFVPGKEDDLFVEASLVGYVDCHQGKKHIRALGIVTDKATYAKGNFGVAVRLLP
jgi:hypothetical protein